MNKIYEPLKEKIREFNKLKIEVFHDKGGMNYFSGTVSRRGVYCLVKPVSHDEVSGMESSIMMGDKRESGFKFILMELGRKNQKKENDCFIKIAPLSKIIADMYVDGKYDDLVELVRQEIPLQTFSNQPKPAVEPMPKMKLLTSELQDRFAKIGSQSESKDPIVVAKFFNPTGAGTWYATEYDPENKVFYGYVELHEGEWGSFSLDEMESFRGRMGLGIERDKGFAEKRFSQIKLQLTH